MLLSRWSVTSKNLKSRAFFIIEPNVEKLPKINTDLNKRYIPLFSVIMILPKNKYLKNNDFIQFIFPGLYAEKIYFFFYTRMFTNNLENCSREKYLKLVSIISAHEKLRISTKRKQTLNQSWGDRVARLSIQIINFSAIFKKFDASWSKSQLYIIMKY